MQGMTETQSAYTVVFASNERGVLPLTVAAFSLVDSARETTTYDIVILSEGICEKSQESIVESIKRVSPRHSVRFFEMSSLYEKQQELDKVCGHWPKSAWARIFIADLLPDVDRVLYLDIDMLICEDCTELFTMDMQGAAVGAVYESISSKNNNYNDKLNIPKQYQGYFNSGTLLMDLNVFRRDKLASKILNFANQYKEHLDYPDQDCLNGALYDNVIRLHPRWNWNDITTRRVMNHLPNTNTLIRASTYKEIIEASVYPAIIHFFGGAKPWKYNYRIMRNRYEAALKKSGVAGYNLHDGWSFKIFLNRIFYPVIYAMVWHRVRKMRKYFNITEPPPASTWGHSRDIATKGWDAELYQ